MQELEKFRKIRRGVYSLEGGGTAIYEADFKKNTGSLGGYVIETDNGTKIHVPQGKAGEVVDAIERASYKKIDETHGTTSVKGDNHGVTLRDVENDWAIVSDQEARRIADSAKDFARQEAATKDALKKL